MLIFNKKFLFNLANLRFKNEKLSKYINLLIKFNTTFYLVILAVQIHQNQGKADESYLYQRFLEFLFSVVLLMYNRC